jgi:hypothetical protein
MSPEPATYWRVALALALLVLAAAAWAADQVVIEDWSRHAVGAKGVPVGWQGQNWGSAAYDLTIVENNGHRLLHLRSKNEGSTISKDITGKVNLKETPILEWSWKVVVLPRGADSRKKETDDQAVQLYVVWPRFPESVRSRIIGYVWDSTAPLGTLVKSEKTRTVTYVVVGSGPEDLGKWLTERRNVVEDYRKIFGEEPDNPGGIAVAIDSNDTRSTAESFMGAILFRKP